MQVYVCNYVRCTLTVLMPKEFSSSQPSAYIVKKSLVLADKLKEY